MQFSSIPFLIFLALTVVGYYALPGVRSRTVWLLSASYLFYYLLSSRWTLVLAAVTLVGYFFGRLIESSGPAQNDLPMPRKTRVLVTIGIVLVAGTLVFFKYTDFAAEILNRGLAMAGSSARFGLLGLALPVGVSFWTFQIIAYLVDVSRGQLAAEHDLLRFGLFVSFFAHVLSGPIGRGTDLLPQLGTKQTFSYDRMRSALLLMLWGFFKKLLIADPLGVLVDQVYGKPETFGGTVILAATVAFALQIYCDFSGYTDIVRGSARLFGVELAHNFDRPYTSRSVKEFWRRWHMSLMDWLRRYVYFPLGGSRVGPWRRRFNVLAVFLFSGLWHGAGLTFIVWGLLNGMYMVVGEATETLRARVLEVLHVRRDGVVHRVAQTVTTFALVTFGWVFFRASSLSKALYMLPKMLTLDLSVFSGSRAIGLDLSKSQMVVTIAALAVLLAVEFASGKISVPALVYRQPLVVRWVAYQAVILAIVIFGYYGAVYSAANFAYFKF